MESRTMKVLMIDDNQDNLTILNTLILEAFPDARVLSALNGQKGLELAASEEPDIILLDIIMPGMDGYEVCRRLKGDKKLCDIPVVFVTAIRSNKDSRIRALECGAEAFLTKPIDDIELTAQIRAMLKIRAANIQKRDEKQILSALVEDKTRDLLAANTELMKTVEALKREQALIEAIFDSIPGYLYVYDESGKLIKWNKKHETMTGYSTEELAHMSLNQWFDQKDIIKVHAAVRDVFEKGNGEVESEERFELLFNKAPLGYQSLDFDGRFIEVNQQWLDTLGYMREEVIGRAFLFGETKSDEFIIQRDDLENRYVLAHAAPIRTPMGIISAGVIVFLDITDKKKAEEGIQHLAYHDYLTDTYNRRFFENEYDSKNTSEYFPLVIVTGDLNGLKLINDSFGHYSGDYSIKQFAAEIQKRIPENAILARVGGDEFSIILTRSSEEEARLLTGELQSNIKFSIKDNKGNDVGAELTATFGYSCQSFPGQGLDELAKEAESFMYRRKFLESTSKRSNVIEAIMSTLFEKSEREQQHSIRVSSVATAIASAMGLDDTTVAKVRVAGSLHDIGKIGIDESILNKTEKLSDQEWELIKQHPIRSARILASVDEYLDIVPIVKAHHERIDGSGYPAGLTDKQIPIEAKIIAVADSFDAMTVKRPYRDAISKASAAEELKRCVGSQFDPRIVEIFVNQVMPNMEQGTSGT